MGILEQYLVYIIFVAIGALTFFITPLIFNFIDINQLDNFLSKITIDVTSKLLFIVGICGAFFEITNSIVEPIINKVGILGLIVIGASEFLTYNSIYEMKKNAELQIEVDAAKGNYRKINFFSSIFMIWIFYSFMFALCVYICSFYFFEKIIPTIAMSFLGFTLSIFLGLEVINLCNKVIDKIGIKK